MRQVNWQKWQKHVDQVQREVPALQAKLVELRQQEKVEIAEETEKSLSYYVPK